MRQVTDPPPVEETLTPREIEVLKHLARGDSNREIALELNISVRTVTTHVRNILDKLDLANRTQAALYAVDHGYVLDASE
jgi:DNA-binding NarL/FixJ family response regulator